MIKKILIFILVVFVVLPITVFADTGTPPSIEIKIINLQTKNYLIDLLVYDEDGSNYYSKLNYNGNDEQYDSETGNNSLKTITVQQLEKLYKINEDGWISESTRWNKYLLFADCSGNNNFNHKFSYFGTPTRYKIVIINNNTGEVKISEEILRTELNSMVTVDYSAMEVTNNNSNNSLTTSPNTIINILSALIITIVVEVIIAYIFKIGNYKVIVLTNLITNLCFQALLILLSSNYLLAFIFGEIIVIASELIIYLLKMKNLNKQKILLYTLVANIITMVCTFLL